MSIFVQRLLLLSTCLAIGCSSNHLAPGGKELELPNGIYEFTARGFALSDDPQYPPCSPLFVPAGGTAITSYLSLAKDGNTWVGRSTAAGDTIEVRFRDNGQSGFGRAVSGTIRGTAPDVTTPNVKARDVIGTFGAASDVAMLAGATDTPISTFVSGRISGRIQFADSTGAASTCTAVSWHLQPR